MKALLLLLATALLTSAAGAFAQSPLLASPMLATAGLPQATTLVTAGGRVTYFGTVSSHDARHAQFAQLRQAFAASKPTLVLIEKPDLGVDSTETATVSRCGETGYAHLLAQQLGVRTERLDDPVAEYNYLRARTEATQLKVYYLLRITRQLRQGTGASKAVLKQAAQQLLANSAAFLPGTSSVVGSPAELEAAYRQLCPAGGQWWEAALGTRPTPAFVQHLDDEAQAYRAQRLAQLLAEKTQAGERVLLVLDQRHLPALTTYAASTPLGR